MTTQDYLRARTIALTLIDERAPTQEKLWSAVNDAVQLVRLRNPDCDVDEALLLRDLEASLNVFQGDSISLDNDAGHLPWLDTRSSSINWSFWNRYLRFLREREGMPPMVLDRLDVSTRRVLGKLEDPTRSGSWDRRGLVVGQVQSGKTQNYTGLICKAADAGYRFVIVLAGIHNSLRSQTQLRLDAGFLGFDTQLRAYVGDPSDAGDFAAAAMGVGRLPGAEELFAISLTNSSERGDFRSQAKRSVPFNLQAALPGPVLLVIKKNARILENLAEWLKTTVAVGDPHRIREHAVLMIDDEADNASINTNPVRDDNGQLDPDYDPTKVNLAIRGLLNLFERVAYVGYTATPYANLYIADEEHPEHGKDLFPSAFIEYIRAPSNYFGPARLFGYRDEEALPLHRAVADSARWMPDKHKSSHVPAVVDFPESLREAIKAFILVRAARLARGQSKSHNSMLVHVSYFKDVQGHVKRQVEDVLEGYRARIRFGDGAGASIRDDLRELWEADFELTSLRSSDPALQGLTWTDVEPYLDDAVTPIEVKVINGTAADTLEYYERRQEGLNVIAIGGNKLSRGLTLEGLSVSYYLRASRTFDTLMQMGRWFGYRPGYEDLCRLYTSAALWKCYREITTANEELTSDFEEMAARQLTPREYGLKVRNTVQGMLVTSPNKMRDATNLRIGFAGSIAETVLMHVREPELSSNFRTLNRFVEALGANYSVSSTGDFLWTGVPGAQVAQDFFRQYRSPDGAWRVHAPTIAKYIDNCCAIGELVDWTVVLVSKRGGSETSVGGLAVGLTERGRLKGLEEKTYSEGTYSIRRILNPPDEWLDFARSEVEELIRESVDEWSKGDRKANEPTRPSGKVIRKRRAPERGLLIIYPLEPVSADDIEEAATRGVTIGTDPIVGFAVSFPTSERAEKVEYTANLRFLAEMFSSDEDDDL
jgi:hypothetical protein